VSPYQEGYSAADASVVNTLNFLKDLEKASDGNQQPILGVIQKLTWLEQHGILKRKPYAVNLIEGMRLGEVSDLEEYYNEGDLFNVLTTKHRFTPEEAKDLMKSGSLKIGLKTYLTRKSDINLSSRNLFELLTSVVDYKTSPFIINSAREFNLEDNQMFEKANTLQKISKNINTLLSEIMIPGHPKKGLEKANLNFILDKISANADYQDLSIALDLKKIDLKNAESRKIVKSKLESALMRSFISKYEANPEWKKFTALMFYLNAGSETNQLLEVRYLDKLESLAVNHNFMLKDILAKYLRGELVLKNSNSSLCIIDPYSLKTHAKLNFSAFKKTNFSNYVNSTVNYDVLKSYNRT
jgi:hypothetical protein